MGGWFNLFDNSSTDTADEFLLDNDTVFDLFEDGEGTYLTNEELLSLFEDGFNATVANDPGPAVSTTKDPDYEAIAKMTPDELSVLGILEIPVLLFNGNEIPFPAKQFGDLSGINECDHLHYHSASAYTLDLKNITQLDNPCGFDNNVTKQTVTGQQMVNGFTINQEILI